MINEFLQYLQYEKNYSSHTVLSYRNDLWQFCRFLDLSPDDFSPRPVTPALLQQWVLALMENEISPRSISRKISTLKSFWRFLQVRGLAEKNPTLKLVLPKTNKQLPTFYKQREMENALSEYSQTGGFEAVRNRMIIELFYVTGLRVSELISLCNSNIDFASHQIRVIGKRNKERIIPLSENVCNDLKSYQSTRNKEIELQSDAFFVRQNGQPMYSKAIYNIVHNKMKEVSTQHKQSPHVLRHTFATTLLNNGADINAVKDLLGHSSLAATQVYTHVSFSELNKIYKQAHPRANKKGGQL